MDTRHIKSLIRRALIRDPSISGVRLGKLLKIDKDTALKYREEVVDETGKRMDKEIEKLKKKSLEAELVDMEDEIKELVREMWLVISTARSDKVKVSALRAIVSARKQMFDLKFDAGLFIRELGHGTFDIPEMVKLIKENVGQTNNNKINSEL